MRIAYTFQPVMKMILVKTGVIVLSVIVIGLCFITGADKSGDIRNRRMKCQQNNDKRMQKYLIKRVWGYMKIQLA